jgi:simple sugar transport system permease protein
MNYDVIEGSLVTAAATATPLLFGGLGATMSERVGVPNYGIEGTMLMGGVLGFIAAVHGAALPLALILGGAGAAAFTLLLFVAPVVLGSANATIVGFAVWFIGVGLSADIGLDYTGSPLEVAVGHVDFPLLSGLPLIGPSLFDQIWPFYAAIGTAVVLSLVLRFTRHGISVKAIGVDPEAAWAGGVPVALIRAGWLTAGGFLMGVGGAVLTVAIAENWQSQITAFRGFLAYGLVLLVAARPLSLIWASYLFGVLLVLSQVGQIQGWAIPSEFLNMTPYLAVLAILAFRGLHGRRIPRSA